MESNGQSEKDVVLKANEGPSAEPVKPTEVEADKTQSAKENVIVRYVRLNRRFRAPVLSLLILFVIGSIVALAYLCWLVWLPALWKWGFEPTSWKAILSVFGGIYLAIGPALPLAFSQMIGQIFNLYLNEQEEEIRDKFSQLNRGQRSMEDELQTNDQVGLIPLIRYSRIQLEAYYSIGLSQTQRSFRYSVVAMWIGFAVIISGVAVHIFPVVLADKLPVGSVREISIAGGTVIEIISALFLWVYRSSIAQLTYFYNRQMDNHSVLLCERIASSMEKADETKKLIVERILQRGERAEQSNAGMPGIRKIVSRVKASKPNVK